MHLCSTKFLKRRFMKDDSILFANFPAAKKRIRDILLSFAFLNLAYGVFAQKADSAKVVSHFSGAASVTNNGISIVPSFSLDKPAAIFMLSMGKKRFSFDPDLRFSLKGKPWSFLFWGRYKLVDNGKFRMNTGAHLGLNFKTSILPINGDSSETTVTRRYLAGELFPRYSLTKNISIGIYYLYSHGLDAGTIGNTNFVTLNANFSNIKISKQFFVKFNPQLYYLKLDEHDGFYVTSTLTLAKKNFPLSISAIVNKVIETDIAGKDLVWNLSLVYAFQKNYVESK